MQARYGAALALLVIVAAGCGAQPGDQGAAPISQAPTEEPAPSGAPEAESESPLVELTPEPAPRDRSPRSLTGTLGGDEQLEGGCVWLEVDGERWQVMWPARYEVSPARLAGPGGVTAEAGDEITVTGRPSRDMLTTCQVGPVFTAERVTVED